MRTFLYNFSKYFESLVSQNPLTRTKVQQCFLISSFIKTVYVIFTIPFPPHCDAIEVVQLDQSWKLPVFNLFSSVYRFASGHGDFTKRLCKFHCPYCRAASSLAASLSPNKCSFSLLGQLHLVIDTHFFVSLAPALERLIILGYIYIYTIIIIGV